MFVKKQLVILAIVLALSGCRRQIHAVGKPSPSNTLDMLVCYDAWDDSLFGGSGAKGFKLYITNSSSSPLENFTLTFNDGRYGTSLADMIYYFGFRKGAVRYGKRNFPANTTLEFTLDHDTAGRSSFSIPDNVLPSRIRVKSSSGTGEWVFDVPES
ncbi:hypothetical protein ACFL1G_11870 [Planctomycetota bacterium]